MLASATLADLLRGDLLGPDELTFVSGAAGGDGDSLQALLKWLAARGSGPWWRCLEWTDRVRLDEEPPALPPDVGTLVWGRWFGDHGDLELWREGLGFRWRFVGDFAGEDAPRPPGQDADFFVDGGAGARLRAGRDDVQHMLWKQGEARVATADGETLRFLKDKPRQAAVCTVYYDHGAVAAVRYRRLAAFRV
jgi:hypothetical protein